MEAVSKSAHPKIRLVAYDWNGTLLDDVDLQYQSVAHVFKKFDLTAPPKEEYFGAITLKDFWEFYWRNGIPRSVTKAQFDMWRLEFMGEYWNSSLIRKDARALLWWCKARGMSQVLITGEMSRIVFQQLGELSLTSMFSHVWSHVESKRSTLLRAIECFGIKPHEVVFIDDMRDCLEDGNKVGVHTIGITTGFSPKERILLANPEDTAGSIREVRDILEKLYGNA
jgi:phosphoglycolate phosphatase